MEKRLVELETRVAFQDDLIGSLNGVVAELQERCTRLEKLTDRLQTQVENLSDGGAVGSAESDETPPHF